MLNLEMMKMEFHQLKEAFNKLRVNSEQLTVKGQIQAGVEQ